MLKQFQHKNVYLPTVLLGVFAFFVGFGGISMPLASGIFVLGWLIDIALNRHSLQNDQTAGNKIYVPILIFFVLSVVSLFYSDLKIGLSVLERRILLLVFALNGFVGFSQRINITVVLKAYVYGVALIMLYIIGHILFDNFHLDFVNIQLRHSFFTVFREYIANVQHRTYLGINIAITMCLLYGYFKLPKVRLWTILLAMTLFVFATGSRATSLTVLALVFIFFLNDVYVKADSKKIIFISFLGVVVLAAFVLLYPRMLDEMLSGTSKDESRLSLWIQTISVISDNWIFGSGIGDFRQVLLDRYVEVGAKYALKYELGPHNQYLYSFGEIGIIGLIALMWIFVGYIKSFPQEKRILALSIVLVFAINFMFESVMLRIWGITSFGVAFLLVRFGILRRSTQTMESPSTLKLPGYFPIVISVLVLFVIVGLISFTNIKFDPANPSTYASCSYTLCDELPGDIPQSIPSNAKGYQLDKTASSEIKNSSLHNSIIAKIKPSEGDSILFSVYCYVSTNFSGDKAQASLYGRSYGAKSVYDMGNRGTWQYLEIKEKLIDIKAYCALQFSAKAYSDISSVEGEVIFVYPIIKIKKERWESLE